VGQVLSLACQEAARLAEIGDEQTGHAGLFGPDLAPAPGVLAVPRGEPVEPCPFPCSICRAKGRQRAAEPGGSTAYRETRTLGRTTTT
jgi:hypothetical protein